MKLKDTLSAIVEALVGPRLDMRAAYPARVVTQNADGTLDVIPDSSRVPPLTKVPIRYGIPGVSATVANDARVLIEFANGDPSKPYASVWESASVTKLTLDASLVRLADGDRNVAREGDPVVVMLTPAALSGAASGSVAITGFILSGTSKVRAP